MVATFKIQIFRKQQLKFAAELDGPVEIGRQQRTEEPLFVEQTTAGARRLAIARLGESTISRAHLRLEPIAEDRFRATNLSSRNAILFEDGALLAPTKSGEFPMPALLTISDAGIRIESTAVGDQEFEMLDRPTLLPSQASPASLRSPLAMRFDEVGVPPLGGSALVEAASQGRRPAKAGTPTPSSIAALSDHDSESIIGWLQTVIGVLQSAASSTDFFERAAAAVVELVGLDSGCVLLAKEEQFRTAAQCFGPRLRGGASEVMPSGRILARMKQEKRTFWHSPSATGPMANQHSLVDVQAVVVAPILDPAGAVIGALYGDRRNGRGSNSSASISRIEAMIVETLACGVAAGLARLDQEQKALAAQVQFEQFFTPELAHQLLVEPDLLKGRDVEVTILFCDIRGFSRISDRLGPAGTVEWIGDVMGTLSDCVAKHAGVLVDYIGDELMAMWGAPRRSPTMPAAPAARRSRCGKRCRS